MYIRIICDNDVITKVYIAPSTEDKIQVVYPELEKTDSFAPILDVIVKKEINLNNPLEFEGGLDDTK